MTCTYVYIYIHTCSLTNTPEYSEGFLEETRVGLQALQQQIALLFEFCKGKLAIVGVHLERLVDSVQAQSVS